MIINDPQISGVAEIADGKWIQWSLEWSVSTSRCILTLKEASFHEDVAKALFRIQFDEFTHERPPSIIIEFSASESTGSNSSISICIAHYDGTIQKLVIYKSDGSSSYLAALDALTDEKCGTSLLKVSKLLVSKSKDVTMKAAVSVGGRNRIVSCLNWCTARGIAFGFRGGDTLLVGVEEEGEGLALTEYLLRDAAFFRVLWNGIMQTDNSDKATIGLCSTELCSSKDTEDIVISVDTEGVLRVWNSVNRKCMAQASLSLVLTDFFRFQNLEDAHISAVVSDCGNVMHISVGMSSRSTTNSEKEWHVAVIECDTKDISSAASNNNDVIMRLMCVLSPPLYPSLARDPRILLVPILSDLQLYPSSASSILVASWKWSSEGSFVRSRNDKVVLVQSVLSTYRVPLANNSINRIDTACMSILDESNSSLKKILRLGREDIAVCELMIVEGQRCDDLCSAVRKLQLSMIQRIFQPKRFEFNTIVSVLANDVPESCKRSLNDFIGCSESDLLAKCVDEVLESCEHWATLSETYSENSSSIENRIQNLARAFLLFLELCEQRADIEEGFTCHCLQRPSHSSRILIKSDERTMGIAVSRKSLGLIYLTIPSQSEGTISQREHSHADANGRKIMQIVDNALDFCPDLTELDVRLQHTFQENAVLNTTNLFWLSSAIDRLAASIQSISPEIMDIVQSGIPSDPYNAKGDNTKEWLHTCFGDLISSSTGSLCHPDEHSWQDNRTHNGQQIRNCTSRTPPSSTYINTASQMAGSEIRRLYCDARTKAVLFSVLATTGGSLHSSVCSILVTDLIPKAIYSMTYWGLLLWLDTVRPVDNKIILDSVDVFDLFITSTEMEKESQCSNILSNSVGCLSLWESYCSHSISSSHFFSPSGANDSLRTSCIYLVQSIRSSPTNGLLKYLSITSQHSAISRVSSLLLWGSECLEKVKIGSNTVIGNVEKRKRIESLAAIVVHGRLRSSVALASFLECFRQMLKLRFESSDEDQSLTDSRHIFLSKGLYSCLEDLIMAVTSPSTNTTADLADHDDTLDGVDSFDEFHILFDEMLYEKRRGAVVLNSNIQCLYDRVLVMSKNSHAFSALIKERNHGRNNTEIDACIRCCCTSPELFLHIHRISHLADIVEMMKRIRDVTVRPNDREERCYGAALAIRANYALADAVDDMLSPLLPSNDHLVSEGLGVRLYMCAEQVVSWSRVFEHAIEQLSFDEALAAVVRLVELGSRQEPLMALRVKEILDSFGAADWHAALGSLVMHACTTGRLGWLCSLDDIWVSGVHISGLIAAELAKLASCGYSSMDGISCPSYYECSCVFALSRQNLQEAARMSAVHAQTIDAQQQALGQIGPLPSTAQIRALSVAVAALSAVKPQVGAYVLLRTKAMSLVGNKRPYSTTVEENDSTKLLPSYDHLSMRTVQQLSASLQLRLALSKVNRADNRGGKDFTALHLAVCLDELEDSDMLLLEEDGMNPSEILSSCLGEKYLNGSGFPSSASLSRSYRSYVIYAIASATVLSQQYDSSSGSSNDYRLHSPYTPKGNGSGNFPPLVGSSSSINWSPLLDALAYLDSSSVNWSLHRSAFEGILKEGIHELPPVLVASYCSSGGDMGALLRILMSHGHLLEACRTARQLMEAYDIGKCTNMPSAEKSKYQIIPYKVIDEIVLATRKYFQLSSLAVVSSFEEEIQRERSRSELKSHLIQLETAIRRHFTLILAAEII